LYCLVFSQSGEAFSEEEKVVISPADGKVIKVEDIEMNGTIAGN